MADGTIKTITDRGFGFIQPANGREDVFFHRTALAPARGDCTSAAPGARQAALPCVSNRSFSLLRSAACLLDMLRAPCPCVARSNP